MDLRGNESGQVKKQARFTVFQAIFFFFFVASRNFKHFDTSSSKLKLNKKQS